MSTSKPKGRYKPRSYPNNYHSRCPNNYEEGYLSLIYKDTSDQGSSWTSWTSVSFPALTMRDCASRCNEDKRCFSFKHIPKNKTCKFMDYQSSRFEAMLRTFRTDLFCSKIGKRTIHMQTWLVQYIFL